MSLLKFIATHREDSKGTPIGWGRAETDGAPFRGGPLVGITEEEYEARVKRVSDPHVQLFDLSNPTDQAAYIEVLDKVANGWGVWFPNPPQRIVLKTKRILADGTVELDVKVKVYAEWLLYYMQDGVQTNRPANMVTSEHGAMPYDGQPQTGTR